MCYFFLDEGALVKGAKELGFFFKTRTPNTVTVEVVSNPHKHHMSLLFYYCIMINLIGMFNNII